MAIAAIAYLVCAWSYEKQRKEYEMKLEELEENFKEYLHPNKVVEVSVKESEVEGFIKQVKQLEEEANYENDRD